MCHDRSYLNVKPKLSSREKEKLKAREWVEFRNYARSCYVYGKSQMLHLRGAKFAADLYRQNWDGCRDLWKLQYHRRRMNITVL